MTRRAVIYARVSQDRDRRGRSVAQQEAECRAFCAEQGWSVAGVFPDNDRSASRYATKDRPQFQALVRFLESGGADVLVTWEASRPTRDLEVFLPLRRLCEDLGVLYSYGERVYDLSDPDDRERVTTDAVKAEAESGRTSKRVKRHTRANAVAGRPHGRNLYGYRRVYDPSNGQLVEVVEEPAQAAIVREAAKRAMAGEALFSIRADFIARGVPAPGAAGWDLTQIRRILLNAGYIGKRVHKGQIVGDAIWPAILDESDWLAIRARLADPSRRSTTRQGQQRHLMSYLARCGVAGCGEHVCARSNHGQPAYACPKYHTSRPRGEWHGWPERDDEWAGRFDGVDDLVTSVVVERLSRPDAAELLAPADDQEDARAAAERVRELQGRLDGFVDAAAAGEITPTALARIEARLLPEIEAAKLSAQPRAVPGVVRDLAGKPDAGALWAELTVVQRREVIDTLTTVELLPAGRGNRRTFDPATVNIAWRRPE